MDISEDSSGYRRILSDVAEASTFVIREMAGVGSATNGAGSASGERDFVKVTLGVTLAFVCCFWSFLAMMYCFISYIKNLQLKKEVARMRAQGEIVELRDLKKKKRLDKQKAKLRNLTVIRESTVDQESKQGYGEMDSMDDETDWIDEEEDNMTDAEEVMRRSWQWKIYQILVGPTYTIFVITLVTVCLLVGILSLILDPNNSQIRQVANFDILVTMFLTLEMLLRVRCFYYCYASFCMFFKDFFNFVDFTVVVIDAALLVILELFTGVASGFANASLVNRYRFAVRFLRVIRFIVIFRSIKVARVYKHVKRFQEEKKEEVVEFVDHTEIARLSMEDTIQEALTFLENEMVDDILDRATRLHQSSWYHFNEAEKTRLTQVYDMFSVVKENGMHRMDVYPALRRFGIKVNISQTRFLLREFDMETGGKGMFTLPHFISICARAQVVAKYEPSIRAEDIDEVVMSHRGLSVIEVRALTDAFDQVDAEPASSKPTGGSNSEVENLGLFFTRFPHDGLLDKAQLHEAIKLGGYNPTLFEMSENMRIFDPSGTGWVSRQDFLIIMGRVPTAEGTFTTKQYAKIVQLFDMYDEQQLGHLSFVQLKALLWRLDLNLRKGAAAMIVDRLFPEGQDVLLDKQTVVSILSHAKARREQYVRGGTGVADTFSPVLDGVELGEDYSRVPKIPAGVLTKKNRMTVYEIFNNFDSTGSGTMPRYLFKKCVRLLGFHQIPSSALDAISRKIPTNKDGRMDFPEFLALVAFVIQNVKRGMYGEVVGSVFETLPDEPEPIEEVLEVVCEPNFVAQFSVHNTINLKKALPAIKAYIDEHTPSASCLYTWLEDLIENQHTEMEVVRFVEVIHDVGEKYYSEFEDRSRAFCEEQLYRWVGEAESRRCAAAFALYTDKASVLTRTQLEPLLVDLGYPVTSHEESKEILKEFSHPKDKSTVLFAELLHILKTLSIVRWKAENGHGDFKVNDRGVLVKVEVDEEKDGDDYNLSPLHMPGGSSFKLPNGGSMKGVDIENADGENDTSAFEAEKKRRTRESGSGAPAGGYMLVAKNLAKKKIKKVRAKDEVDEEGYVKPKSAYEIFVHTNPTADQLDLLYQWDNLMTELEKNTFKREAKGMREAYDQLKGGVVNKETANEVLKRKGTSHTATIKKKNSHSKRDSANKALFGGITGLDSDGAGSTFDAGSSMDDPSKPTAGRRMSMDTAPPGKVAAKVVGDAWETASNVTGVSGKPANKGHTDLSSMLPEEESDKKRVTIQDDRSQSRAQPTKNPFAALQPRQGLSQSKPITTVAKQVVEDHSGHLESLAKAPPPIAPSSIGLPQNRASVVIPKGLSATGVPAELTSKTSLIGASSIPTSTNSHLPNKMSHIVGPMTSLAPPPPPRVTGVSGGGRPSMAPVPSFKSSTALSMPLPPQFADPRVGMGAAPPPPPSRRR